MSSDSSHFAALAPKSHVHVDEDCPAYRLRACGIDPLSKAATPRLREFDSGLAPAEGLCGMQRLCEPCARPDISHDIGCTVTTFIELTRERAKRSVDDRIHFFRADGKACGLRWV